MCAFRDDASDFSESQEVRTVAETEDLQWTGFDENDANIIGIQGSHDGRTFDHWDSYDEERAWLEKSLTKDSNVHS